MFTSSWLPSEECNTMWRNVTWIYKCYNSYTILNDVYKYAHFETLTISPSNGTSNKGHEKLQTLLDAAPPVLTFQTVFVVHLVWSRLRPPYIHRNAATNQRCCPQCEQACQHSISQETTCLHFFFSCLHAIHIFTLQMSVKLSVSAFANPPKSNCNFRLTTTRVCVCVYICKCLFSRSLSLITPPHTIKSTNAQVHIQELGEERQNNPGSPWEQMSPAQTSDRLPQPTARLKVLCRAEGGHYCWPFLHRRKRRGGGEEAAGFNTALAHSPLLALFFLC